MFDFYCVLSALRATRRDLYLVVFGKPQLG